MSTEITDYRNAKYQGHLSGGNHRQGIGILIDDNLSFYASNWNHNQLNGATLLYFSHGKYIYGNWKENEPHGLNVFRSGDTVLLGNYHQGVLHGKSLVIFERMNFITLLDNVGEQCEVLKCGQLLSHQTLLEYIQLMGTPVPDHYYSLTKFACSMSNGSHSMVRTFPCFANYCYFGFINGLAIVFNSNNAVISVGKHVNEELAEFGAHFEGKKRVCEGNYETKELIRYSGERPINKILKVYQKIHKRSLNFLNQYFDSKVTVIEEIQQLIRGKIQKIVENSKKKFDFSACDLNDSLDFQDYNQEESKKMESIRDQMYDAKKTKSRRNKSELKTVTSSHQSSQKVDQNDQDFIQNKKQVKSRSIIKNKLQLENHQDSYFPNQKPKKLQKMEEQYLKTPQKQSKSVSRVDKLKICSKQAEVLNTPKDRPEIENNTKMTIQSFQQLSITKSISKRQKEKPLRMINSKLKESFENENQQSRQRKFIKSRSNIKYLNLSPSEVRLKQSNQNESEKKCLLKANQIYKEKLESSEVQKEQQSQSYQVPTFKLLEESQKKKFGCNEESVNNTVSRTNNLYMQDYKIPQQKEEFNFTLEKNINKLIYETELQNSNTNEDFPTKRISKIEEDMSPSKQRRSPLKISQLAKPSYEDIEDRRKRLLRQFQDLNACDSPCNGFNFSSKGTNVFQQSSVRSGYMPLTIDNQSSKNQQKGTFTLNKLHNKSDCSNNQEAFRRKGRKDSEKTTIPNRKHELENIRPSEVQNRSNYEYEGSQKFNKQSLSPSPMRKKRSYKYIYE